MVITGKKVFNIIYIASLVFHVVFLGYKVITKENISEGYVMIATSSIIAMSLIMLLTKDKRR